jgi:pimeloyl-ACP methyl ester carboxylesterase
MPGSEGGVMKRTDNTQEHTERPHGDSAPALSQATRIAPTLPPQMTATASAAVPTYYRSAQVDGLKIAYREAGDPGSPKLVLLHGFPASSHQYRDLIPAMATHFHVIAPDYPGFGHSDMPDPATFGYTFDRLSEITEAFLKDRGFDHYGLFVQDYGGPVGFRIVMRHPEALDWLIIQNTNAYEIGFTSAWDGFRGGLWKNRSPETERLLSAFLEHDAIKSIYLFGAQNPDRISPDNWESDSGFMQRPNAKRVQLDLFYDYRTNVELYPKWQAFLRERQPKTIIFWGQQDIFFTPEGGEAYLTDLPKAEMHRLAAGHFAVEDSLNEIVEGMHRFYLGKVRAEGKR